PTGTLSTTSEFSMTVPGTGVTWIMNEQDLIEFDDVTPEGSDTLEYHYFINGTETVTDEPTLALPDYAYATTYQIQGYVKDTLSGYQSPTQTLNVIVGDYAKKLWGTVTIVGANMPANSGSSTIQLPSDTPVSIQFAIDQASLAVWPSN